MGNYYTLAEARADGLTIAEAGDDAVNTEIALAEELLEKWTGRKFYTSTLTLNLDGTGTEWLDLTRYKPINSITSVTIDGESINISSYIKSYLDAGYLRIARVGWSIYSGNKSGYYKFTRGTQNNVIVGSFYGTSVPVTIKRIVKLMIFRELRPRDKVGQFESEKTGNYSYKLNTSKGQGGVSGILTGDPQIDRMISTFKHKLSFKAVTRGSQ